MVTLFFDTETTDLPNYKSPPGPHQPHVVQMAALLIDGDTEKSLVTLIRPDGWKIAPEAQAVHGITQERAAAEGMPIAEAVAAFDAMLGQAKLVVAHNVKFDRLLMESEYLRLHRPIRWPRTFCTMLTCTDIVRLPTRWGGHKWPTLDETYRHFFKRPLAGAHDALADVRACHDIFQQLVQLGCAPQA